MPISSSVFSSKTSHESLLNLSAKWTAWSAKYLGVHLFPGRLPNSLVKFAPRPIVIPVARCDWSVFDPISSSAERILVLSSICLGLVVVYS